MVAPAPPLNVVRVPIDSVREHPDNARRGDMATIVASLRTHGQYVPILVHDETGFIVKGNHTHRAMKSAGFTDVDVIRRSMTDAQAYQILLVDNVSSDRAEDDLTAMVAIFEALGNDTTGTGYTDDDLAAMRASLEPPEPSPYDTPSTGGVLALQDVSLGEPRHQTSTGQVWKLGPVDHEHDGPAQTSGPHYLAVVKLATGWPVYLPLLEDGALLLPYPGPYLPVTRLGLRSRCVFVQPDLYIAGHLLDKWSAMFPDSVSVVE